MDRGKKILFAMFWNGGQWNNGNVTKEDLEYAEKAGYLFKQPSALSHEEALRRLKDLLVRIDARDVANAFLYSLSTRDLEYRSALGSYYYAAAIPEHEIYKGHYKEQTHCYFCGWYSETDAHSSYNVYNFERYKWGGVRHTKLDYALFDLEQFLKLPKVAPNEEDISLIKEILACVQELEPNNKAGKLRDIISKKKLMKTNKDEISILLEILGICGILAGKDHPGYGEQFVDEYGRSPKEHTNDMQYPVNHWRAADGINTMRFEEVFGFSFNSDASESV